MTFQIFIDESLNELNQDDPKLIAAVKKLLIPPTSRGKLLINI